jgi:hypothetical protein
MTKAEQIVMEALELPSIVRAFVAEKLIESLDSVPADGLSPEWKEELRKRCREVDDNLVALRDAESVFKTAFALLG